jgi:hypothetical protein
MKQRLENIAAQTLNPIDNIPLSSSAGAEELEKHFANVKRAHPEIEEIFVFPDGTQAKLTPSQSNILALFDRSRTAQNFLDDNRNYLFALDSCPSCQPNGR